MFGKTRDGRGRKVLASLVVVGVAGSLIALGAFSAFTSTTSNSGNSLTAGTVVLADNDAGSAMYNTTNLKPGDTVTQCIKVTYTGSLDADVKLYGGSVASTLGNDVNLAVRPGSGNITFPSCTGFTADASDLYSGSLSSFPTTYAAGITDSGPGAATKWVNGDAVVYRYTLTLSASAPDSDQGLSTGSHSFTWEARNQ